MRMLYFTLFLFMAFSIFPAEKINYLWKPIHAGFDSMAMELERTSFRDENRTEMHFTIVSMDQIVSKQKDAQLRARSLYWKAWTVVSQNKDSAYHLLDNALALTDSGNYSYDYHRMKLTQTDIKRTKNEWLVAYKSYKELEHYFRTQNDKFYLAKIYVAIGSILFDLKDYKQALSYFRKGEKLFQETGSKNSETKNKLNIGNILYLSGQKERAVLQLDSLSREPVIRKDTADLINVLISLYAVSDNRQEAAIRQAYQLSQQYGDKRLLMLSQIGMGVRCLMNNKSDSALLYYRKAYSYAMETAGTSNILPIIRGFAEAHERLNHLDSACFYLKQYNAYKSSILSEDKIAEVNRFESLAAIGRYELDLKQAEETSHLRRNIIIAMAFGFVCFLLLILYIFLSIYHKGKIKKQLHEAESRELVTKLRNESLEKERYQLETESKNRELTSNTLILTEKNQTLKELLKQIREYGQTGILPCKEKNVLENRIKQHLMTEDELQYFNIHFEKVHPNFFIKLKERFPGLSENDLRICAYIRIGMSTKEVAQLLSVLPDTIHTTRYRIRKKLNLEQEESIENFLRSF